MDQENKQEMENKSSITSNEQKDSSREGYVPVGNQSKGYQTEKRTMRPRINSQRAYSSEHGRMSEGGFRPEGFGAALQQTGQRQRTYRPRIEGSREGGYQSREGGYQPREGGYQPRERGYQSREGGYQPRQQGFRPRQQGYRPRFNQGEGEQGGYQPRQQGYQPRYNAQQGGYQSREGGYQPRERGYQSREGGYQPRQQGFRPRQQGYRPRFNQGDGEQGGYRPRSTYNPGARYNMKRRIDYKEEQTDPNEPIRLNKFLANAGICSRREADEYIQAGVIKVNGETVKELGTKVLRTDEVVFHDQKVGLEKKVYVLLNKPKDTVTTSDDPQQRKTVMDLVSGACPERIYPVGRLDRNTTGVLLLTNDGDLASKLTHPKFLKKKVYHVYLDKNVTAHDMQQITDGIELEDGEIRADSVAYADESDRSQVGIEIHSGKNRIVRRIFESLGYRVIKLDRVQFAGLTKKNLRRGDWRFLTEKEVEMLRMGAFE